MSQGWAKKTFSVYDRLGSVYDSCAGVSGVDAWQGFVSDDHRASIGVGFHGNRYTIIVIRFQLFNT